MSYLVGVDEAGYGPNLGPLVVAAAAFEVPDEITHGCLYERLADVVDRDGGRAPLRIDDSKRLFQAGKCLRGLEHPVLSAVWSRYGKIPASFQQAWRQLDGTYARDLNRIPWFARVDVPLPAASDRAEIAESGGLLAQGLARQGIRLAALEAVFVVEGRFNCLLRHRGTKGAVLSDLTLRFLADLMSRLPQGPVHVCCDRHGGRRRYAAPLQNAFPADLVRVRQERSDFSSYDVRGRGRSVQVDFIVRGEQFLATALASMTAKYLRELGMQALNAYWAARLPGLRRTSGYPVDAQRFMRDIGPLASRVPRGLLWRTR